MAVVASALILTVLLLYEGFLVTTVHFCGFAERLLLVEAAQMAGYEVSDSSYGERTDRL
jgi:hypothetical protein